MSFQNLEELNNLYQQLYIEKQRVDERLKKCTEDLQKALRGNSLSPSRVRIESSESDDESNEEEYRESKSETLRKGKELITRGTQIILTGQFLPFSQVETDALVAEKNTITLIHGIFDVWLAPKNVKNFSTIKDEMIEWQQEVYNWTSKLSRPRKNQVLNSKLFGKYWKNPNHMKD